MNSPEPTEQISLLSEEYFFEFGGIKPEYEDRIDQLTELVSQMPGEVFVITGHTDGRGSEAYNLKLSQKRADYIRNLILNKLEYQGFNIEDYKIISIGLANIAPNIPDAQTEIEHDQNRRVSLFLLKENSRVATILKEKFPKWKE
jgi:OOP family OmpA-OmpF porin